jgi:DNA-binding response OmpR family regulator
VSKPKILVVDDDRNIASLVKVALQHAGYAVRHVESADEALVAFKEETPDLTLLDVELPGLSGLKLLNLLKEQPATASIPIIMISVLGATSDRIKGLKTGADDYLAKPFSTEELLARIEALLRRVKSGGQVEQILVEGDLRLDLDRRQATAAEVVLDLTSMEFDLLALLLRRPGYVHTYKVLADALGEGLKIVTSETLYTHVKNLRRKMGSLGTWIETVHGVGYRLNPEKPSTTPQK